MSLTHVRKSKDEAALKRGVDDLQNRLEWVLRNRPRALINAQAEYRAFCLRVYNKIQRVTRGSR